MSSARSETPKFASVMAVSTSWVGDVGSSSVSQSGRGPSRNCVRMLSSEGRRMAAASRGKATLRLSADSQEFPLESKSWKMGIVDAEDHAGPHGGGGGG